jgi:hypothetical protein
MKRAVRENAVARVGFGQNYTHGGAGLRAVFEERKSIA